MFASLFFFLVQWFPYTSPHWEGKVIVNAPCNKIIHIVFKELLEQKCQVVNFAELHLKCFQSGKSSHMTILILIVKKKPNHFEYPSSAFLKDSWKVLLRNYSCYVIVGSSNLYSRFVAAWRYIKETPTHDVKASCHFEARRQWQKCL